MWLGSHSPLFMSVGTLSTVYFSILPTQHEWGGLIFAKKGPVSTQEPSHVDFKDKS